MRVRTIVSIGLVFALAACGGGGGGSQIPGTGNNVQGGPAGNGGWLASTPGANATWHAQAGGDRQKGALQALAMLPDTITIDEGDSIEWTVAGEVHTITFLPAGAQGPPGDPTVPQGGSTYDGTQFDSSGILAPGQHYTLTFTKAGTYGYQCFLHGPEMTGTVIVQPKGTPYPRPQGFYTGLGTSTLNAILSDAMSSVTSLSLPWVQQGAPTFVAAGAAPGGPSAPPNHATVLRFLRGDRLNLTSVTVPLGGTITWINKSNNEPHTVTFPIAGEPLPPLPGDPFTPPMGGNTYDGTQVTNSGPLGPANPTIIGLPPGTPNAYSLTFTKRGTFVYFCLFHDEFGMMGTVNVI